MLTTGPAKRQEGRRKQPHVAGKHDEFHVVLFQAVQNLFLVLRPGPSMAVMHLLNHLDRHAEPYGSCHTFHLGSIRHHNRGLVERMTGSLSQHQRLHSTS